MIFYSSFLKEWNKCLSDHEILFSSINLYSILKYLIEYWKSIADKNRSFSAFEKDLCKKLKDLIEDNSEEFIILKNSNKYLSSNLSIITESLIKNGKLTCEYIIIIENILDELNTPEFITEIFKLIFTSSCVDRSIYLIKLVLRILIEKNSSKFLMEVPKKVYVDSWLKANTSIIRTSLDNNHDNFIKIFTLLINTTKKICEANLYDENFQMECISGDRALYLHRRLDEVIQYAINQLEIESKGDLIKSNFLLDRIVNRIGRYYYHTCFNYLLNCLHLPPDFNLVRQKLFNNDLIRNDFVFSDFFKSYNEKYGLFIIDTEDYKRLSIEFVTDLYKKLLSILTKFASFKISEFNYKCKLLLENSIDGTKYWMYHIKFKDSLNDFFIQEFEINFNEFIEHIQQIEINCLSTNQLNNFIKANMLKIISKYVFKEIYRFDKFYSRENHTAFDEMIVKMFINQLFHGFRQYRVFFSIRGFESKRNLIDLGDVKIYDDTWNFLEKQSFLNYYNSDRHRINKFKFKICIDIKSNNPFDAIYIGRQKCHNIFANIVFTHKVVMNYDRNKRFLPEMETYYEIIDIPLTLQESRFDVLWPIDLDESSNSFLEEIYEVMNNNEILKNSFTWFKEGVYADSSFLKFLAYWTGLESFLTRLKSTNRKTKSIFIFLLLRYMLDSDKNLCLDFIKLFDTEFKSDDVKDILKELVYIYQSIDNDLIEQKIKTLNKINLDNLYSLKFVLSYLYKKRNAIAHEGETFSFEIIELSLLLEKYIANLILFFKN